jgi:hypothetical protein
LNADAGTINDQGHFSESIRETNSELVASRADAHDLPQCLAFEDFSLLYRTATPGTDPLVVGFTTLGEGCLRSNERESNGHRDQKKQKANWLGAVAMFRYPKISDHST